jgi:chromatin structure-remodeling complex subunit RSC1/2
VQPAPVNYKAPPPNEVYILPDHANASIPPEIRAQFQRDEQGRVLFFTAPPLNTGTVVKKEGAPLGHSAGFLAAKAAREQKKAAKRKATEADALEREEATKRARSKTEEKFKQDVSELKVKAINALENQLTLAVKTDFEALFQGEVGVDGVLKSLDNLTEVQRVAITKNAERNARILKERERTKTPITGMTVRLEESMGGAKPKR